MTDKESWDNLSADDFGELIIFHKWEEFIAEGGLAKPDKEIVDHFTKRKNITKEAPLSMLFAGFVAGFNKGLDIVDTMEKGRDTE